MAEPIERLQSNANSEEILEIVNRDGAAIVENFLPEQGVEQIYSELRPFIEQTIPLQDDFSGHQTTRTGGLVPKSAAVRKLITDRRILGTVSSFLEPFTEKVQLNLTQIIRLLPGQGSQELHRDRFIWGKSLPREIEPQLNTITAVTDFTADNGATQVVPGSHLWDWERSALAEEITQAVMPRGSVMFYTGSVLHGGGQNRTDSDRIALNITYINAWLRQEENQYLTCPPDIAKSFEPDLRDLLGYTMANYALGYYSPPSFISGAPGTLPPELAVSEEDIEEAFARYLPEAETF